MRNYLLGGVAVAGALTFMIQSGPAMAQPTCGVGQHCGAYRAAGVAPMQNRYPRHSYSHGYGGGYGIGVGAAVATGVILGGALQQSPGYYPDNQGYYPDNQGYYPAPVYSDQSPAYSDAGPQVVDDSDSTAYCQRTYRSYDTVSGTYLGYDGIRHPCP
jgi:BA14K-like protein